MCRDLLAHFFLKRAVRPVGYESSLVLNEQEAYVKKQQGNAKQNIDSYDDTHNILLLLKTPAKKWTAYFGGSGFHLDIRL